MPSRYRLIELHCPIDKSHCQDRFLLLNKNAKKASEAQDTKDLQFCQKETCNYPSHLGPPGGLGSGSTDHTLAPMQVKASRKPHGCLINNTSRQSRQFNIYLVTILLPMVNFKILHPLKGTMKWPGLAQTTLPVTFFAHQAEHYYFQISLRFTYMVTRTRPD